MSASENDPVILAGARTPFVKAFGAARDIHVKVLAARVMREALDRSAVDPARIARVVLGNVVGPPDASNVGRVAALLAGILENVPAVTVNRNCASGMEAVAQGAAMIRNGEAKVVLAGGAESMSMVPFLFGDSARRMFLSLQRARSLGGRLAIMLKMRPSHFRAHHGLEIGFRAPTCSLSMGETAEILAAEYRISREEQDQFALLSHQNAVAAKERLAEEIAPLFAPGPGASKGKMMHEDIGPRPNQTNEALARLRPAFDKRGGSVTAGNASPITDGAAALVLASPAAASELASSIKPLGRLREISTAALSPRKMGLGPAFAIPKVLARSGVAFDQLDLIEINEAFAAQVIACERALASDTFCRENLGLPSALGVIPREKLNVNGGAIALGHPVGASGARLILTLLMELRRRDAKLGVASLCVGGGQGMAALLERM